MAVVGKAVQAGTGASGEAQEGYGAPPPRRAWGNWALSVLALVLLAQMSLVVRLLWATAYEEHRPPGTILLEPRLWELAAFGVFIYYLGRGTFTAPASGYRRSFFLAMLVLDLRFWLFQGNGVLADCAGLVALQLIFQSQISLFPDRRYLGPFNRALQLAAVPSLLAAYWISPRLPAWHLGGFVLRQHFYSLWFAALALLYLFFLAHLFWQAARLSFEAHLRWRFFFLVLATGMYVALYVTDWWMRTTHSIDAGKGAPPESAAHAILAGVAAVLMLCAFAMPGRLASFLTRISLYVDVRPLHRQLVQLLGALSERTWNAADHPLPPLAVALGRAMGLPGQRLQVLETAACLLAQMEPWDGRLADLAAVVLRGQSNLPNPPGWGPGSSPGAGLIPQGRNDLAALYESRLGLYGAAARVLSEYERFSACPPGSQDLMRLQRWILPEAQILLDIRQRARSVTRSSGEGSGLGPEAAAGTGRTSDCGGLSQAFPAVAAAWQKLHT